MERLHNTNRKRSSFVFDLSDRQLQAFVDLAMRLDLPIEQLLDEAIDRYIKEELSEL